ncbi:MAG: hypothetical protein KY476_12890, partial [Planctomycetes bacterium]|nr:hypothetical protein [Planctomycetota bacterium]
ASRGRWREAAEAFTAAAALQPGLTADQWYELSFARLRNGEADEARRGLATALALDAQHPGAAALARELGGVAFSREPVSVVGHAAREEPRIGHAASELAPPRIAERSAWTTPAR